MIGHAALASYCRRPRARRGSRCRPPRRRRRCSRRCRARSGPGSRWPGRSGRASRWRARSGRSRSASTPAAASALPRRLGRQRRGGLAVAGDVARLDAGALDDPFVGGVDPLGELGVGDPARRQRRAGADDRPRGGSFRGHQLGALGRDVGEILGDLAGQVLAHHPRRDPDRIGDALVGGAAMALHDQAVEAEEDRAIMVVRIEMVAQQFGRRARDQEADLRADRAGEGALQQVGDEARRALERLQRDIAGKAVGDDHVDVAARQLVALDEAVEAHVRDSRPRAGSRRPP